MAAVTVKRCCVVALTYKYVVEQQPIGRELFIQFCDLKPQYRNAVSFLEAVVSAIVPFWQINYDYETVNAALS